MGQSEALWVIVVVLRITVNKNERRETSSADLLQLLLSAWS
jgi:hypothetical protein